MVARKRLIVDGDLCRHIEPSQSVAATLPAARTADAGFGRPASQACRVVIGRARR
jgi:hypothetical protein